MIVTTDNANYAAIADAIRAKNGTDQTYTPAAMAAAIAAIETGGGTAFKTTTGECEMNAGTYVEVRGLSLRPIAVILWSDASFCTAALSDGSGNCLYAANEQGAIEAIFYNDGFRVGHSAMYGTEFTYYVLGV